MGRAYVPYDSLKILNKIWKRKKSKGKMLQFWRKIVNNFFNFCTCTKLLPFNKTWTEHDLKDKKMQNANQHNWTKRYGTVHKTRNPCNKNCYETTSNYMVQVTWMQKNWSWIPTVPTYRGWCWEPLDMELLGSEQEVLKVTLVDVHLPLVHEVQDRHQVTEPATQIFSLKKQTLLVHL